MFAATLALRRSALFGALAALPTCGCSQVAPAATNRTEFGVHLAAGCDGRRELARFERFAERKVERVVDAYDQRDWTRYASSIDWIARCWKGAPQHLTISVPMLVNSGGGTLTDGARGAYDAFPLHIAQSLVENGRPDAVVRIGWEFNGNWMPWRAADDPAAFVAYYRRIVQLMRSVPGQRFRFEWTTAIGRHALDPTQAYPGDDVVDVVGTDVYNEYWSAELANSRVRFAWLMNQPFGLAWVQRFARAHGKASAYSEWGTGTRADGHGAGDDPYFVQRMAAWFAASGALYQSYWEVRNEQYDDTLSYGRHPHAAAAFRAAFAERPGERSDQLAAPRGTR